MADHDALAGLAALGFSPFKVICSAHGGTRMVRRGGARSGPGGGTEIVWEARRGAGAPAAGSGIYDELGVATFELACPGCGHPRQFRRDRLAALLRDRAQAGQVDSKGRVVLDLSELAF